MSLSKLQAPALWEFSTSRKFVPCRGNVATLRAEVSPLAWLLELTKSLAWLVSRVVGFTVLYAPGPGCIKPALKCPLKYVTYESVMGTLMGVAWNTLSTLVSFCFTW